METFECWCGGTIRPQDIGGQTTVYRQIPDLPAPQGVTSAFCDSCGDEYIDGAHVRSNDEKLEMAYRSVVARKARESLEELVSSGVKQWQLEELLGLSSGYLSKVKGGSKDPSPVLTAVLLLLASVPARVKELENRWRVQPYPQPVSIPQVKFTGIKPRVDELEADAIVEGLENVEEASIRAC